MPPLPELRSPSSNATSNHEVRLPPSPPRRTRRTTPSSFDSESDSESLPAIPVHASKPSPTEPVPRRRARRRRLPGRFAAADDGVDPVDAAREAAIVLMHSQPEAFETMTVRRPGLVRAWLGGQGDALDAVHHDLAAAMTQQMTINARTTTGQAAALDVVSTTRAQPISPPKKRMMAQHMVAVAESESVKPPRWDFVAMTHPEMPVLTPNGGTFDGNELKVTIISPTKWCSVRWTSDGTEPTVESALYRRPVILRGAGTHTLRAVVFRRIEGSVCSNSDAEGGEGGGTELKNEADDIGATDLLQSHSSCTTYVLRPSLGPLPARIVSAVLRVSGAPNTVIGCSRELLLEEITTSLGDDAKDSANVMVRFQITNVIHINELTPTGSEDVITRAETSESDLKMPDNDKAEEETEKVNGGPTEDTGMTTDVHVTIELWERERFDAASFLDEKPPSVGPISGVPQLLAEALQSAEAHASSVASSGTSVPPLPELGFYNDALSTSGNASCPADDDGSQLAVRQPPRNGLLHEAKNKATTTLDESFANDDTARLASERIVAKLRATDFGTKISAAIWPSVSHSLSDVFDSDAGSPTTRSDAGSPTTRRAGGLTVAVEKVWQNELNRVTFELSWANPPIIHTGDQNKDSDDDSDESPAAADGSTDGAASDARGAKNQECLDATTFVCCTDHLLQIVDYRGQLAQKDSFETPRAAIADDPEDSSREISTPPFKLLQRKTPVIAGERGLFPQISAAKRTNSSSTHSLMPQQQWESAQISAGKAVAHSDSNVSQEPGRSKRTIAVMLSALPRTASEVYFALSARHGDLSRFAKPRVRVFDETRPEHTLISYNLADAKTASAVLVCRLVRPRTIRGGGWRVDALGHTTEGNASSYEPMERSVLNCQAHHSRWRAIGWIILLERLWRRHRADPRAESTNDTARRALLSLFVRAPLTIFRHVAAFL